MKGNIPGILGALLLSAVRPAGLPGMESGIRVDYVSSYIWRGFDLNPTTRAVVQPSFDFVLGETGLSLRIWSSFSFEEKELHETDLTLNYRTRPLEDLEISAGLIHYGWYFMDHFKFREDTSQEIYISGVMKGWPFNPGVTLFYDFTNGDGLYALFRTDFSWTPISRLSLDLSGSLGYNGGQWLAEEAQPGWSDLNLGADLVIRVGRLVVAPFVRVAFVLLDALERETYVWGGMSFRFAMS